MDPTTKNLQSPFQAQVFDAEQELLIGEHARPHWMQSGTITFITMRLADSIPKAVVRRWDQERLEYLQGLGIDCQDWRVGREQLSEKDRRQFQSRFDRLREDHLDACHGACQLKQPAIAELVSNVLMHFDGDRYLLGDFVIMPNHVHLLAVFPDGELMAKTCSSWMRYSATQINRMTKRTGTFWQEEPFDHLIRSERQLQYLRGYIADNPAKAKLREGEYVYRKTGRTF